VNSCMLVKNQKTFGIWTTFAIHRTMCAMVFGDKNMYDKYVISKAGRWTAMQKNTVTENGPDAYRLTALPLGAVTPQGWLRDQLIVQKNGLTGHIEDIWPDLGSDSGWLGGTGESWERGPYYLDGLIPLAWSLNDDALKHKAMKWIEWMLASQDDSGFFGPKANRDWWPRIVALKALMQYHQATDDPRVLPFMDRYLRYQLAALPEAPFEMWGTARAQEELIILHYVYRHTQAPYLMELAKIINGQCYAWEELFRDFPYRKTTHAYLNKPLFMFVKGIDLVRQWLDKKWHISRPPKTKARIEKDNANKFIRLFHETHSVNLAMALKMPALKGMFSHSPGLAGAARTGLLSIMKYHGQANFVFSGDEHLNGKSPTSGAELCLVVEYLYSLSQLYAITGDAFYGDLIEQVAYNALPATFTEDMCAHQYVQQVNQVEVSRKHRDWYDAYGESNLFGLEPNYGCCTANMHQGWPKLLSSLFFTSEDTVTAGVYAPCRAALDIGGTPVVIEEETEYPFRDSMRFVIVSIGNSEERLRFHFRFRLPGWVREYSLTMNSVKIETQVIDHFIETEHHFKAGDALTLTLPMELRLKREEPAGMTLHRGPLLFALPIEGNRRVLRGDPPFADYEIFPASPWAYALVPDMIDMAEVNHFPIVAVPFSDAGYPLTVALPMVPAPKWRMEHHSAGPIPPPFVSAANEFKKTVLVPYGSTRLRVAQFPIAFLRGENGKSGTED
jgi:hypothetical protein